MPKACLRNVLNKWKQIVIVGFFILLSVPKVTVVAFNHAVSLHLFTIRTIYSSINRKNKENRCMKFGPITKLSLYSKEDGEGGKKSVHRWAF